MTDKLYAQVNRNFLETKPQRFLVVAAKNFSYASEFTEKGYDTYHDEDVTAVEITPSNGLKYASNEEVIEAAEAVGIRVFMNLEDFKAYYPNSAEDEFKERSMYNEFMEANELLENSDVVAELEKRGFDAFDGFITIANMQPYVVCFWKEDSFTMKEVDLSPSEEMKEQAAPTGEELWIAEFETRSTSSRAVCKTPEDAVAKLVDLWIEKYAPMSGADDNLIVELREEIVINKLEVGKAYLKGGTDILWHGAELRGDDSRFDEVFDSYALPKP